MLLQNHISIFLISSVVTGPQPTGQKNIRDFGFDTVLYENFGKYNYYQCWIGLDIKALSSNPSKTSHSYHLPICTSNLVSMDIKANLSSNLMQPLKRVGI